MYSITTPNRAYALSLAGILMEYGATATMCEDSKGRTTVHHNASTNLLDLCIEELGEDVYYR